MNLSPRHAPLHAKAVPPWAARNLACGEPDSAGHFLFPELPHNLRTHNSDGHHAVGFGKRTAGLVQRTPPFLPVFSEVDHLTHSVVSSSSLGRACEPNRRAFHRDGKTVHD